MKAVFTYDELDPTELHDAFARSGTVEVSLHGARAGLCRRLLENLNRVRAYRHTVRDGRAGRLSLVSSGLNFLFLNVYVGVVFPKLMVVLAFYVAQQPVCQIAGREKVRILFSRGRGSRA